MLVLSRKEGERIVIGGTIVVTIVETRGGRVRIGVDAPPEVPILRDEVGRRTQPMPLANGWRSAANESIFLPEFA
jgi:carbon storage regulator